MTEQMTLDQYRYRDADICARKHHGNPNSVAALSKVRNHADTDRTKIYQLIKASPEGMTLKELCSAMQRLPNEISRRITELKTGRYKNGRILTTVRGTRNGCGINIALDHTPATCHLPPASI